LKSLNIPLISIAITNNVNPTTMTKLSNLFGDKKLILIKDDDNVDNFYSMLTEELELKSEYKEFRII
jgi:hypothetical protein